jgi:hypothetical protein
VGIFQDHYSRDWDDAEPSRAFDAVFEPGRSYTLTAGVIGMGGNMLEGVPLEMALYAGAATGSPRTVAALTITNGPAVFPNRTNLVDHTLRTPMVRAGDAWAGQHIGIRFLSTVTDDMKGGYWVLDNVRLSSTPGPASPGPLRIRLESPGPRIEWDGFAGRTYRLWVSTDLAAWLPVGDLIAGVDGTMSRTVPFDGGVARFFRLEIPTVP